LTLGKRKKRESSNSPLFQPKNYWISTNCLTVSSST